MYITDQSTIALSQPQEEGKKYTHHCDGQSFSQYNHELVVYHKRQFKKIEWKNLGFNMSIPYLQIHTVNAQWNDVAAQWVTSWYQGFDEEKGQKYYFLHNINSKEREDKKETTQQYKYLNDFTCHHQQYRFYTIFDHPLPEYSMSYILSTIFMASLLYGKRNIREIQGNKTLIGIKIQFSLIMQNIYLLEWWEKAHQILSNQGYFNDMSITHSENSMTNVQYTINDFQILEWLENQHHESLVVGKKNTAGNMQTSFKKHLEDDNNTDKISNGLIKFLRKSK